MQGLEYRLKSFLPNSTSPALLVDASAGLSLGVLPGLEDFENSVRTFLPKVNGVVCSPGLLHRLTNHSYKVGSLLVRMDWTNTLRGKDFPLPPEKTMHLKILDAVDALALGAVGMVTSFLLGYEEAVEASCQLAIVQLSLAGKNLGLPLLAEVRITGSRVSLPEKAIELGASYALESGADGIIIPYPGQSSLKRIASMSSIPWLIKPTSLEKVEQEWEEAGGLGAAGLWFDHTWLGADMPLNKVLATFDKNVNPED